MPTRRPHTSRLPARSWVKVPPCHCNVVESGIQYHPTADQHALADTIETSLAELLPLARIHRSPEEAADTWAQLEAIGVFAMGVGEADGGSGLGAAEEVLIAMALGRRLASPSVFATIGAAHARSSLGSTWAPGTRVSYAYRRGAGIVQVSDSGATKLLVRSDTGAEVFESPRRPGALLDGRLWVDSLNEQPALSGPLAEFDAPGLLRLRLLDAASLAGIAQAALDMSVAYAGDRHQFGRPIGSFQAVKHHCANMAIAARCARDQATFAAVAIDGGRDDAAFQVESALFVAGSAALENAGKNIQIHGGFGFSDEADPHLLLKRARVLLSLAGGLEAANNRVENSTMGW
jgi:alkylation response protein AidB-like acyl-CoA dehydrogenase